MKEHPLRQRALEEIHARPFESYPTPRAIFHQAYMAPPSGGLNREAFSSWCEAKNIAPPDVHARHHVVALAGGVRMIWERHHEFITLTWDCENKPGAVDELVRLANENESQILVPDAALISLVQLDLIPLDAGAQADFTDFDPNNTCATSINDEGAVIGSDFKMLENGATHISIFNRSLDGNVMGSVVRRVLEIETYRVLSLLGYVTAKQIMPDVSAVEARLVDLIGEMDGANDLEASRSLLKTITKLATSVEAISAKSQFRLSATKAYYNLVNLRLSRLVGAPYKSMMGVEDFLGRRLAPAMRTCESVEDRIFIASKKLSRAANLLRTRVDIQLEAQNHELLESMDRRARQQFRLQQTVEGLSIAAVSYYVVSLIGYLAKGVQDYTGLQPGLVMAMSVPLVLVIIWMLVRRIRNQHSK